MDRDNCACEAAGKKDREARLELDPKDSSHHSVREQGAAEGKDDDSARLRIPAQQTSANDGDEGKLSSEW